MKKKQYIPHFLSGIILICILVSCNQQQKKVRSETEKAESKYRVGIELVLNDEALPDSVLAKLNGMALDSYSWKNHIVLFGNQADTFGIASLIRNSGIELETRYYNEPMYVFDRAKCCGDSCVPAPWKDYLLTANLVADSTMQQEYMHYHETQFEEWPEVAQGFCNASFQQLLVFRNGRQLLLVISIPADKTLDELNPKTEENNPRVVEWNKIMSKYQEGIEGTSPGESWVFLNKIENKKE